MPTFTENFDSDSGAYALTNTEISGGNLHLTATGQTVGSGSAQKIASISSGSGFVVSALLTKVDTIGENTKYTDAFTSDNYTHSGTVVSGGKLYASGITATGAAIKTTPVLTNDPIRKATIYATVVQTSGLITPQISRDNHNFFNATFGAPFDFTTATGAPDFVSTGVADTTNRSLSFRHLLARVERSNAGAVVESVTATGTPWTQSMPFVMDDKSVTVLATRPLAAQRVSLYAYRSSDGGATWSTPSLIVPSIFDAQERPQVFVASKVNGSGLCAVFVNGGVTSSGQSIVSSDRGNTWSTGALFTINNGLSFGSDVISFSGQVGYFAFSTTTATGQVDIYRSSNSGLNFSFVPTTGSVLFSTSPSYPTSNAPEVALEQTDSGNLHAIVRDTGATFTHRPIFYRSSDAGKSWSSGGYVLPSGDHASLITLHRKSDSNFISFLFVPSGTDADNLMISRSADSGATWTPVSGTTRLTGLAFSFFNSDILDSGNQLVSIFGVSGGLRKRIIKTTDGGLSSSLSSGSGLDGSVSNSTTLGGAYEPSSSHISATYDQTPGGATLNSNQLFYNAGVFTATGAGGNHDLSLEMSIDNATGTLTQYIDYFATRNNRHFFKLVPGSTFTFVSGNETDAFFAANPSSGFVDATGVQDSGNNTLKTAFQEFSP